MQKNVALKNRTSFRIGGTAEHFFAVHNLLELQLALDFAAEKKLEPLIIGGGTNILLPDTDLPLVIQLQKSAADLELADELEANQGRLSVWAGEPMAALAWATVRAGWAGLADFASLPGSVGGAIWNNAHYGPTLVSDCLVEVTYFDRQQKKLLTRLAADFAFAYDQSWFQQNPQAIIVTAVFQLQPSAAPADLTHQALATTARRKATQPYDLPSAGCFWRNPKNTPALQKLFPEWAEKKQLSAGFLIEQAGLKGKSIGGAQVSQTHAAFIVNTGAASSSDVRELARLIQQTVQEKFGINLQPEVMIF